MPNWCENKLVITGKSKNIRRFFDRAFGYDEENIPHGGNFLRHMLPNPHLDANDCPLTNDNSWYEWEQSNYGCKWGASDTAFDLRTGTGASLTILFNSPWGPPEKGITILSRRFPSLHFALTYSEPGMAFKGESSFQGGKVLYKECHEMTQEEMIEDGCAGVEAIADSLRKKLHPSRFTDMSPRMAAYVAYLLHVEWTKPTIGSIAVTSDGFMIVDGDFHGSVSDFDRNLQSLCDAAGLYDSERDVLMEAYRTYVLDYRPTKGIIL